MKTQIIWKAVVGYEGLYEVSNTGYVRSLRCIKRRVNKLKDKPTMLKFHYGYGYRTVCLSKNCKHSQQRVHRLVLTAFIGPPKTNQQTRHLNGIKTDNNLRNLSWGTSAENYVDRKNHGTDIKGITCGRSKLKNEDVFKIRSLLKAGMSTYKIARKYNVDASNIGYIARRVTWKHL